MANKLTTNPKYVDTAATISSVPFLVRKFWFAAAADDQDVILKDIKGNVVWHAKVGDVSANGYNAETDFGDGIVFESLVVDTIDGGFLLIYS